MKNAIAIDDLSKDFGLFRQRKRILNQINLEVKEGETLGLFGSNGSGKTTLMKICVGLVRQSSGSILYFGTPLSPKSRRWISFLPEYPEFMKNLKAREVLQLSRSLSRKPRKNSLVDEVLATVGLQEMQEETVETFSKGMRQRLGLAQALIGDNKILIMDEPMSGLDPEGREHLKTIIKELREKGVTQLFSTHQKKDTESLCDRVMTLKEGSLYFP